MPREHDARPLLRSRAGSRSGLQPVAFSHFDLERMIHQEKYLPYESSDLFADGKAMRSPLAAQSLTIA